MLHRLDAVLAAATIVAVVAVGCAGPGAAIADRIRAANSPIVREVVVYGPNPFTGKGDQVHVYLVPEATEAEGLDLWCNVMVRAGVAQLGRDVDLMKGDTSSPDLFLMDVVCPG